MIKINLAGRLGNQLYQYCACRSISEIINSDFSVGIGQNQRFSGYENEIEKIFDVDFGVDGDRSARVAAAARADVAVGPILHVQHRALARHHLFGDLSRAAVVILGVPDGFAVRDPAALVAERRFDASRAHDRPRRLGCGG